MCSRLSLLRAPLFAIFFFVSLFSAVCLILIAPSPAAYALPPPGKTAPGTAAQSAPPASSSLNVAMTEIGGLMAQLIGDKALDDPDLALKRIDALDQRFAALESHTAGRGPTFRISWETLEEQIARTRDAVDQGYATRDNLRNLVHGIAMACAGCHTQDDMTPALSFGKLSADIADPLDRARFSYITRDYATALKLYDEWLDRQSRLSYTGPVLDAFEGELTIYAQIYHDPELAIKGFKRRLDRSGGVMSKQVRQDIQDWIAGFTQIRKDKLADKVPDYATLERYAQKYILDQNDKLTAAAKDKVIYLWLRGLFYEYVQAHPDDSHMANLLLWLASTDRVLEYNLYYSLANLYLRECVLRYPTADVAEDCYDEYARYVAFAYSGSSGEHVPQDAQEDLARMREVLDAAHAATEIPALPAEAPDTKPTE